jgi:hypothetical protein
VDPRPQLSESRAALTLTALGIVYGDIGTSPLYAAKETFHPDHGIAVTPYNVLGGVSAIFWALMIVVTLKYVILIMRANNNGEGGIMALLALASQAVKDRALARADHDRGRLWRRVVLWRRRTDTCDLGAVGRRGPRSGHCGLQAVCSPNRGRGRHRACLLCSGKARQR